VAGRIEGDAMNMIAVDSSQLSAIGYDPARSVLAVRFKNGGVYEYKDVTPETFEAFLASESKGKYFGKHVRGTFEYTRMPEEKQKEVRGDNHE
jgi:hypothetical protein